MLKPLNVFVDDNFIEYRLEEGDVLVYKSEINTIKEETGCTMQNIQYPVPGLYLNLAENFGNTIDCGNLVNNFFSMIKSVAENVLLIIDFQGVNEVSEGFCKYFAKYLLTTENKVIYINQNIDVSNIFGFFIYKNVKPSLNTDRYDTIYDMLTEEEG